MEERPLIGILDDSHMKSGMIYFDELKYLICRTLQLKIYWTKLNLKGNAKDLVYFNDLFEKLMDTKYLKSLPVLTNGREPRDNAQTIKVASYLVSEKRLKPDIIRK